MPRATARRGAHVAGAHAPTLPHITVGNLTNLGGGTALKTARPTRRSRSTELDLIDQEDTQTMSLKRKLTWIASTGALTLAAAPAAFASPPGRYDHHGNQGYDQPGSNGGCQPGSDGSDPSGNDGGYQPGNDGDYQPGND